MTRTIFVAFAITLAVLLLAPVAWTAGAKAGSWIDRPAGRSTEFVQRGADIGQVAMQARTGVFERPAAVAEGKDQLTELEEFQPTVVKQLGDFRPRPIPDRPNGKPEPRKPLVKVPTVELAQVPADATGVLIVKFSDESRTRFRADGMLRANNEDGSVAVANALIVGLNLELEPAFLQSDQEIAAIEQRAALISGRAQPDLAGMYHLRGRNADLVIAAQTLNDLEGVEFVEFEREMMTGLGAGGPPTGACCIPSCGGCEEVIEAICDQIGGTYQGDGTTCAGNCQDPGACCIEFGGEILCVDVADADECLALNGYFQGPGTECFDEDNEPVACEDFEIECGACGTGSCLAANNRPFCEDATCCEFVCDIDPFCCGLSDPAIPGRSANCDGVPQCWDEICVQHAIQFCQGQFPGAPNPVCAAATGPCHGVHPGVGCNDVPCCELVCDANPSCCSSFWGGECVALAIELCTAGADPGPTPNFQDHQGYLTPGGYIAELGDLPERYDGVLPRTGGGGVRPGWGGEGHDLELFDVLGQFLLDEYGIGNNPEMPGAPTVRGETIRVGVIEHTAFVRWDDPSRTHEALIGKVTGEPGQTPLIIPGTQNLTGDHGTACLGIIGGHGPITGVAPGAQLYFFPIVSAEEGGRLGRAIVSALSIFEYGDVLSFSIGPGGGGTLASSQRNWMLLRLAADLGVTCVVSAGNDCLNIDDTAQFGGEDSDVIIVGAVYPGRGPGNVHCRLPFSNFCNACTGANRVHVGAWGMMVTTAGYGNLYAGAASDPNTRKYTHTFSGTSAAAPMVAGLAARLQSLAKQFYGIPLPPEFVRSLISGNGIAQCNAPVRELVPGHTDPPGACGGSWDMDAPPDLVGGGAPGQADNPPVGLTMLMPAGEALVSSELFTCIPMIQSVETARGVHIAGNVFSVCNLDGIVYKAESVFTEAGHGYITPGGTPLTYVATGQIVDILVKAVAPSGTPGAFTVTTAGLIPSSNVVRVIAFMELFDWQANRWMLVGAGVGTSLTVSPIFPWRFVNPQTHEVHARQWVIGFSMGPSPFGGTPPAGGHAFEYWLDLFSFEFEPIVQP